MPTRATISHSHQEVMNFQVPFMLSEGPVPMSSAPYHSPFLNTYGLYPNANLNGNYTPLHSEYMQTPFHQQSYPYQSPSNRYGQYHMNGFQG